MRIIALAVLLLLIGCKDPVSKESNKKPLSDDAAFKKTFKEDSTENVQSEDINIRNQDSTDIWKGKYYFESINKDDLKTSFEISIKQLNDISVKYSSDDNKPEVYNHIAGELENPEKLKINFNPDYEEMGVIFLEKDGDEFTVSGEPIYFVNPGNDNLSIKKTE
ncbi:MAG: hypothetical protein ABI576_00990 [Flavobacterium sp.]